MTREEEATPPAHNQAPAESIRITVNGEERRLLSGTALSAFLEENDVPARFIAVAVNQEVVRRDEHRQVFLQEGDVVEIVRMVGGGSNRYQTILRSTAAKAQPSVPAIEKPVPQLIKD